MSFVIISIEPVGNRRQRVCLDQGTDFLLYRGEVGKYGLKQGEVLSEDQYQFLVREVLSPRAVGKAMQLLEQRDYSEKGLRDKLMAASYPEEAVCRAIEYVKQTGYLDDSRLAASYVCCQQEKKSKRRIGRDLLRKGFDRDLIDQVLDREYEASEDEQIRALLRKKHYVAAHADQKEKGRLYRFLAYRGFSSAAIMKALQEMDDS